MKKLILIIGLIACLTGCCETVGGSSGYGYGYNTTTTASKPKQQYTKPERPAYKRGSRLHVAMEVMTYEGHDYLIFASYDLEGGVCAIHSESCRCHNMVKHVE